MLRVFSLGLAWLGLASVGFLCSVCLLGWLWLGVFFNVSCATTCRSSQSGAPAGKKLAKTKTKRTLLFVVDECDLFDDLVERRVLIKH